MAIERRVVPRLRLRRKLTLTLSSNTTLHAWSYDLSSGGLQLRSEQLLPLGAVLELVLPIPDVTMRSGYHRIELRARVVHVVLESSSGHYRIGVEFVEFYADGHERFARYWDELLHLQLTRAPLR